MKGKVEVEKWEKGEMPAIIPIVALFLRRCREIVYLCQMNKIILDKEVLKADRLIYIIFVVSMWRDMYFVA